MIRYEYEQGFCKQLHYNGLWRVQYECTPGHFEKVKMACTCMRNGCDKECDILDNIPKIKDPTMEWHMKDESGNMVG